MKFIRGYAQIIDGKITKEGEQVSTE